MIDLRSDTVTVPTEEMRQAIACAEVGDDVYGEDKTTNELQEYVAGLLDKEAALFVPSGTMANQIAIASQTHTGDEIIAESDSHIFYYETAGPAVISRVQVRCIPSQKGMMNPKDIESAIRTDEYYFPRTTLICLENTHNRHGGSVIELQYIREVRKIADAHGLKMHCDGARLWNACAAAGISPEEYAQPFDSVSVCLSKGLGAPVGSLIAGTAELIERAGKWRKILGGGMRQTGILASAGLHALRHHLPLLQLDNANARLFGEILRESTYIEVDLQRIETNMVVFKLNESINVSDFVGLCRTNGLLISGMGGNSIRAVFHFQVDENQAIKAANIIKFVIHKILN